MERNYVTVTLCILLVRSLVLSTPRAWNATLNTRLRYRTCYNNSTTDESNASRCVYAALFSLYHEVQLHSRRNNIGLFGI